LLQRFPDDSRSRYFWSPTINAVLALRAGELRRAIDVLDATIPYELWTEFPIGGELRPTYLRGLAYLKAKAGRQAAAEFEKIVERRGVAPVSVLYPLAHLGLARAAALNGDTATSRKAYETLFELWHDADPDLPLLREARTEFQMLK